MEDQETFMLVDLTESLRRSYPFWQFLACVFEKYRTAQQIEFGEQYSLATALVLGFKIVPKAAARS
jgi:hypothetical protein